MAERLKDILKKKPRLFEDRERISKDDLVKEMHKLGRELNARTCDYYARIGVIKNPYRIPGEKRVFWDKDYIINELLAVETLIVSFHQNLSRIIELAKATHYRLENLVIDVMGPLEPLLEKYRRIYDSSMRMRELREVYEKYFDKIISGKIRTKEDHIGFLKMVEEVSVCLYRAMGSIKEQARVVERGGYNESLSKEHDQWMKKAEKTIEKW